MTIHHAVCLTTTFKNMHHKQFCIATVVAATQSSTWNKAAWENANTRTVKAREKRWELSKVCALGNSNVPLQTLSWSSTWETV